LLAKQPENRQVWFGITTPPMYTCLAGKFIYLHILYITLLHLLLSEEICKFRVTLRGNRILFFLGLGWISIFGRMIPDNPTSEMPDPDFWLDIRWWPDTGFPAGYCRISDRISMILQDIKNNSVFQVPAAVFTEKFYIQVPLLLNRI